jgi:hypothetical protein
MIRIDLYGRSILAERRAGGWQLSCGGEEGKRRPLSEIIVPRDIVSREDLVRFLADLYHESARPGRDKVRVTEV